MIEFIVVWSMMCFTSGLPGPSVLIEAGCGREEAQVFTTEAAAIEFIEGRWSGYYPNCGKDCIRVNNGKFPILYQSKKVPLRRVERVKSRTIPAKTVTDKYWTFEKVTK